MRLINNLGYNEHTAEYFISMKVLPVDYLFEYFLSKYILRTIKEPEFDCVLSGKIVKIEDLHNYATRSTLQIVIPRVRKEKTKNSLHYTAVTIYNKLPDSIKTKNLESIKSILRQHFLNRMITDNAIM